MKTTYKAFALAILLVLGLFTVPAHNEEQRTNTGTTLNNVVPSGCGVQIDLPGSLTNGATALPLRVSGAAGNEDAVLSLRIIAGGEKIGNVLWLDTAATMPAGELDWPVPARTSRTVTLFIKGVDISSALNDVKLRAAMSCGATATDTTTVVRPCSLLQEPAFPGHPGKWFYAEKVELVKANAFGGALYKVTWIPPDAIGVFDQGGSIHPNPKDFAGNVRPGPVTTYHIGPRSHRLWVSKSFTCDYTDPCVGGAPKPSDSTVGWALLGVEGPIVNPGRINPNPPGPGDDQNAGGGPLNPPPPPPDAHGQGQEGGDPPDDPDWPNLVGTCENPWPDLRTPTALTPAEGVEIVAEEIQRGLQITGFRNANVEDEQNRRYLTMTGTAKIEGSVSGVIRESSGVLKTCRGSGLVITDQYDGDPGISPFGWIDQVDPLGWNATENTQTSHGGDISWTEWNEEAGIVETMTWSFHWTLSDEYTSEMVRADAISTAWKFRDIYSKPPGHDLDYPTFGGCRAQLYSDENGTAYGKLRYKIRVPETWHRPMRVSWVERFSPAGQVHFDGQVREGEEYAVKTAIIPAGATETEAFEIDPANIPDKQGEWDVFLLNVEDASLAYDTASREMLSVAGGIPDSGRMPPLGISITNVTRIDGQYRVSVAVDYEDPHGDISGAPANDLVIFLVDGLVVGEIGGLSDDTGGETDMPWKVKNSKRTIPYEFTIPPKQGITTLTVKTVSEDGFEAATASTGLVLDLLPEGTQAPASHTPQLTTDASFGPSDVDQLSLTFPGAAAATLTETGSDTLVFVGEALVAGEPKMVSFKVDPFEPDQTAVICATMEIGTPADAYRIGALRAEEGQPYETRSIHRVIASPASDLPTIHISTAPDPAVADTMGVVFPGGSLATLVETEANSKVFAGEAVVRGSPCQAKVMLGGLEWPVTGAPAFLSATVHLQNGGDYYIESNETAAESGEFEVAHSRPLATTATTAVAFADTRATLPVLTGSHPFMLRFRVPAFLAAQVESGEIGIWLDDHRMTGETNGYLKPDEDADQAAPIVCVMDGSGPEVFTWSRVGTDIVSSPAGIISGDSFEITFRKDDETIWSHTYGLESQAPEPLGEEMPEPPFEEQVAGWYLVCFGHFGQALVNSFESLGGTINYWYVHNHVSQNGQPAWDAGLLPRIDIDRRQGAFAAATAQYQKLLEAFHPTAGASCQALSHEWQELKSPPLHLKDEEGAYEKWTAQWLSREINVCGEQLQEFADWWECGVRIAVSPVDVTISICEATNHFRKGEIGQGGITLAMGAPYVGKMAAAVGKPLVMKLGKTALIRGGFALTAGSVIKVTKLVKSVVVSGRARVEAVREIRRMLESGQITRGYLENLYDSGQLKFKMNVESIAFNKIYYSQYKVLTDGIEARTLKKKLKGQITHHDLPLQLEREFLARGIDPNDGLETGTFVDKYYHQHILHNGAQLTSKFEACPGGAWNYQWKRYFLKNPGATVEDIKAFNKLLWDRVQAAAPNPGVYISPVDAKRLFDDIQWPFTKDVPY